MTATEDYKVQASYKHGDRDQHMLNVRAGSAIELKSQLADLSTTDVLDDVVSTGLLLGAITNVQHAVQTPAAPAQTPVPGVQNAPTTTESAWGTPAPTPAAAAPPTTPATPAAPSAPTCTHGTRTYKTGTSAKGAWQAWMCPAQKGDPTQCKPQWIN